MKTQFTVAIIGCGQRGMGTYGSIMLESPERFRIVSVCDINPVRLAQAREKFGVAEEDAFLREEDFFAKRRADLLLVTTLDADHVRQGIEGLRLGYDLLMEKPITADPAEAKALLAAQQQYGGRVTVCHVLRYAPAFRKAAELLQAGRIGRLAAIDATEQVAFWHQSHSFVRGNWRRTGETAPMILAKCCHDLDLLQWYAGSRCVSLSSVGELTFFKEENAPEGSAARCLDCALADSCPFSAKRIYLDAFRGGKTNWPVNVISDVRPLTEEAVTEALREGPYGRCVFRCDNDAVDHQLTLMTFENGVKASLTMTAFTKDSGRIIYFRGTAGELILNEETDRITLKVFGGENEEWKIAELLADGSGHGGGDTGLVNGLYEALLAGGAAPTALAASVESHLMGFAAERSRLAGGRLEYVHEE